MYIARKIDDYEKFTKWCLSGTCPFVTDSSELDDFSSIIDFDVNVRTLKRRCHSNWKGYFQKVLIFRDTTLVSWRDMAFGKRWSKWFVSK